MKKKKLLSVKELVHLPQEERAVVACYGMGYDWDAVAFSMLWAEALESRSDSEWAEGLRRDGCGSLCDTFVEILEPRITEAVKTGDGTFLRKLADAIERRRTPLDRVRFNIGMMAAGAYGTKWLTATPEAQRIEISHEVGYDVPIVQFRRWAADMGLSHADAKRGRKPACKLKSKKAN